MSESDTRAKQIRDERMLLWGNISTLLESGRTEEAISTCRVRLADPLAHIPSPATGTPDELRVMGYAAYAISLDKHHIGPNAPFPDPQRSHEVVSAYKKAAEGAVRHYDLYARQANLFLHDFGLALSRQSDAAANIPEYEKLVELYKEVLYKKRPADLNQESEGKKEYKDSLLGLVGILEKLGDRYMASKRRDEGLQVKDQASSLLDEYTEQNGLDMDINRNQINLLYSWVKQLDEDSTIEERTSILSHCSKCRQMMEKRRINGEDDVYLDSNHAELESSFAISLATIAEPLPPQAGANGEINAGDLLRESSDIFRRLSRLPEDLEQGIPPDVSLPNLSNYVIALRDLGSKLGSYPEALPIFERAFRIECASVGFQPTKHATPIPPYSVLIEGTDWTKFNFNQLKSILGLLWKVTEARSGWIVGRQSEGQGTAPEGMMEFLEKETKLALRLIESLSSLAATPDEEAKAKIEKANGLILVGELKIYQNEESPNWKEVKQAWREALAIVQSFAAQGFTERNRRMTVVRLNGMLSRSDQLDPELARLSAVLRESELLWDPVDQLLSDGLLDEAITLCRERMDDPLSHLPTPTVATKEELRTKGYYRLAVSLNARSRGLQDTTDRDELLDAYQNAAEGYRLHFPSQKKGRFDILTTYAWLLVRAGQPSDGIDTYKSAIELAKELSLSRYGLPISEDAANNDKALKLEMLDATSKLTIALELIEKRSALDVMQDALQVIEDYIELYGSDLSIELSKADLLTNKAISLHQQGKLEEALVTSEQEAQQYRLIAKKNQEEGKGDKEQRKFYDGQASALRNILSWSTSSERMSFDGKSLAEIREEVVLLSRLAAGLPEDLDDPLPSDLQLEDNYLHEYFEALQKFAQGISSESEKVPIFENAIRVFDLHIQAVTGSDKPSIRPYSDVLTNPNWEEADVSTLWNANQVLLHLSMSRLSLLKEGTPSSATSATLGREFDLASSLNESIINGASETRDVSRALLQKIQSLINRGSASYVGRLGDGDQAKENARKAWMEAKDTLSASSSRFGQEDVDGLMKQIDTMLSVCNEQ